MIVLCSFVCVTHVGGCVVYTYIRTYTHMHTRIVEKGYSLFVYVCVCVCYVVKSDAKGWRMCSFVCVCACECALIGLGLCMYDRDLIFDLFE